MKIILIVLFIIGSSFIFAFLNNKNSIDVSDKSSSIYEYFAHTIDGEEISFKQYKGKKIIIVNVASKCGYTPQYLELQQLHEDYNNNLVVLGVPSNDFLWQEPGSNDEIKTFCRREYGVTFQMFQKIHVRGKHMHDIYKWLSSSDQNGWNDKAPTWNFCKYLIDEKGNLIEFYKSRVEPTDTLITRHLNSINLIPQGIEKN